jgi:uncharacterized GH25 family protein
MRTPKIILLTALLATATSTLAHTPYLQPTSFEVNRSGKVSLDASFAEKFFVPEVAFNNSIFLITAPNGKQSNPEILSQLAVRTVLEHTLSQDGTYRFSTGSRLGKIFKVYEQDGKRHSAKDPKKPIPDGAKLLSFFQSNTKAETYITKGKPNTTALTATNAGLELVMKTHPNELFVDDEVSLMVLFDGQKIDDVKMDIMLAQYQFSTDKPTQTIMSDEGKLSFKVNQAGSYLLRVRHRTPAPKNAVAPVISNTYTLTLEIIE